MVVISMRQDVSLVAPDYYKQEITYQDQIDKLKNTNEAGANVPNLIYNSAENKVIVSCPVSLSGEIQFYRPSDATKDITVKFNVDQTDWQMNTATMNKGLWKVKISWENEGKTHYKEQNLVL